jgi:diguanylate cyclase (GGDEF)-like protein/PAS domain S-box-containing protein
MRVAREEISVSTDGDFYRNILESIGDGVYFVDRERRISFWSRGAERISGYQEDQVMGSSCADGLLMHVDDNGTSLCHSCCPLAATLADGQVRETQVYLHHAGGHRVPVLVRTAPIRGPSGKIEGAVETFSDNSSLMAALKRVRELSAVAVTDPLTGIGNRRSIELKLEGCLAECRRLEATAGVMFIDVDHFKGVNDTFGHDVGDKVLRMVAETLKHNLRSSDSLGRWGGDEFLALLLDINAERLLATAEKLRMLVANSYLSLGTVDLRATISLGATLTRPDDTPEILIKRADALLYESKSAGRNRFTLAA